MIKILLVEDNALFRKMFKQMLINKFSGISVVEASNCADGFGKLNSQQFDLVFTDINLPDGNGLKCIGKMKALLPDLMVVVFSFSNLIEYQFAAIDAGARHFFSKQNLHDAKVTNLLENVFTDLKAAA